MKNDCIVCAKTFDDPELERITCSKECSIKWQAFLKELKTVPEKQRSTMVDEFFSPIYLKLLGEKSR